MQSLTQASSGTPPAAASAAAPGAGAAPAAGATDVTPVGAAGGDGCVFGAWEELLGCTCWAKAAGIASAKASAPTPAHSVTRAGQRLTMFDRTPDQTITTFPLFAGSFGSVTGDPAPFPVRIGSIPELRRSRGL